MLLYVRLYNLTAIAWERYIAVRHSFSYKVIVTRDRVKKYANIAWLLAVLTTTPVRILQAVGVDYKYLEILNKILSIPVVICIVLIGYFYTLVYLGVHKQKVIDTRQGPAVIKEKLEKSISNTTGILTAVLLISYLPSVVVLLFGGVAPFLRTSTLFRWSETLIQLNSLVNPLLYCIVLNRQFRKAILDQKMEEIPQRTCSRQRAVSLLIYRFE